MEALQKAQENFEQAQQEVIQAQTDLDKLIQEAPLPVMPVPQVNMSLVKSLEALTGIIENMSTHTMQQSYTEGGHDAYLRQDGLVQ